MSKLIILGCAVLLGERYYVTLRRSPARAVHLSSVQASEYGAPTSRTTDFSAIFLPGPSNSLGNHIVSINILHNNLKDSRWSGKLNGRGMKNWRFSTNPLALLFFENGTEYGHSYNGRRIIGTRMRSIE